MAYAYLIFLLACLCSSVSSFSGTSLTFPGAANESVWQGYTKPSAPLFRPHVRLIYDCPRPVTLQNYSSHELLHEVWARGYANTRTSLQVVINDFDNFLQSGVKRVREAASNALEWVLEMIILSWSYTILAAFYAIYRFIESYPLHVAALALLYVFTTYMVKAVEWIFGDSPIFLLRAGLTAMKGIFKVLWSRRSYNREKSVKGFLTFTIPQNPPKNCILEVQHSDGSHSGYASCVQLYNGTTGLLTAQHAIPSGCKIVSTRNGNKIPISEFRLTAESGARDLVILTGPPNWEGTLACKAAQYNTATRLCKSKASIFTWKGESWESSNADIVGLSACKKFVTVLSNTTPGHSGAPYFNGKTILGVHVGGAKDENANYMAPIPAKAGLTSPNYVFETTAPQGKIFTEEDIQELLEDFSWAEIDSIMKHRNSRPSYAMESEAQSAGNEAAAASAKTTANPKEATPKAEQSSGVKIHQAAVPKTPKEPSRLDTKPATYMPPMIRRGQDAGVKSQTTTASTDVISEIRKAILEKIDVRSIERQVVQDLSDKAMKKPRHRTGRKRSANKQRTSEATSTPSTSGTKGPERKSQDSKKSDPSPSFTSLDKRANRVGERKSPASTQSWRPKQGASGGPSSAH